jgi:hypothetical protein
VADNNTLTYENLQFVIELICHTTWNKVELSMYYLIKLPRGHQLIAIARSTIIAEREFMAVRTFGKYIYPAYD